MLGFQGLEVVGGDSGELRVVLDVRETTPRVVEVKQNLLHNLLIGHELLACHISRGWPSPGNIEAS